MVLRNFDSSNDKRTKKRKNDYRPSIITERFLTMFLKVLSSQSLTKRNVLLLFQKFINQIDLKKYEKDTSIYPLIVAINIVIKNKLEDVIDKEELVEYVNLEIMDNYEDVKDNIIFPTILSEEASEKEKKLVLETIETYIRYESVLTQKEELSDALSDIGSGNINNLKESLDGFKSIVSQLYEDFKKTEFDQEKYSFTHTCLKEEYIEKLKKAYDCANSPKMVLKTGLKRFNKMLSQQEGFLGSKFYMFYADTNTFKSALLRYCAKWIKKYNGKMFKEEYLATGLIPTILFVSLEDGEIEDTSRTYSTFTKHDLVSMDNFEEVKRLWEIENSDDDDIIDITQVNSSESSINLKTIESFERKLKEEGYFIIAIIVDSFDLMSPSDEDIYRGITDDTTIFSNRAKAIQKFIGDKPYPFISAHQLNRAGNQFISEKKDKGVVDLAKSLGRSFISGAYDIERRVHWSAFIYTEWSKYDNELYLEIKREKVKYKKTPEDYLVHWLENGFMIHDDYNTNMELSRSTILPTTEDNTNTDFGSRGMTSISRMHNDVSQTVKEENNKPKTMFSSSTTKPTNIIIQPSTINYLYTVTKEALDINNIQLHNNKNEYTYNDNIGVSPFDL